MEDIKLTPDQEAAVNEQYDKLLESTQLTKDQLTEEEIQKISDKIESSVADNDKLKIVAELPSNNGMQNVPVNVLAHPEEAESREMMATVNPANGLVNVTGAAEDDIPEVDLNDYLDMSAYDKDTIDIDKVGISQSIIDEYNLTDEEVVSLISLLKRVQAGEKGIPYYNELPKGLKQFVDIMCMENGVLNKPMRNAVALNVIDSLFNELGADLFTLDITDVLNNEIKKSGADLSGMYEDMILGKKEKLAEAAIKARENGETKSADTLQDMADACEESYMMTGFIKAVEDHKIRIRKIDIEKPEKVVREFNHKYENSKLGINNAWDLTMCIPRHLAEASTPVDPEKITFKTVIAFVVAFCKYCSNMQNTNVKDHIFMYYFIKNILYLDTMPPGAEATEFGQGLIDRIKYILEKIHENYGY